MDAVTLDASYLGFLLIDLIAIFTLLAAMRWFSRFLVKPNHQHNEASNLETAAALIALAITLTGVSSGEFSISLSSEWLLVTGYGLLALFLLILGAWLQDRVVLPSLALAQAIQKGDIEASYISGAHLIGTAIVIQASMHWAAQDGSLSLAPLLLGFIISQLLLALETRLRLLWISKGVLKGKGQENKAATIKAAAQHIGAALAISGSAQFATAMELQPELAAVAWLLSSLTFLLAYLALSELCVRIILPKHELYEGGRPALEGAIYIGWGLILPALAS